VLREPGRVFGGVRPFAALAAEFQVPRAGPSTFASAQKDDRSGRPPPRQAASKRSQTASTRFQSSRGSEVACAGTGGVKRRPPPARSCG
jgi:hypothetical protein